MKKNDVWRWISHLIPSLKRILFIMKLIFILLCTTVGLFANSANTNAQKTKISLEFENTSIRDVLGYIEDHSDYLFMYNNSKVNVSKQINIKVIGREIDQVLNALFSDESLAYYQLGNHIIIMPESDVTLNTKQQHKVSGKVTDMDGNPLPGVNVLEKGTTNGAVTDLDGNYTIAVTDEEAVLTFSYIGYLSEEIEVGAQTTINISLVEDIKALDEVIVVEIGRAHV